MNTLKYGCQNNPPATEAFPIQPQQIFTSNPPSNYSTISYNGTVPATGLSREARTAIIIAVPVGVFVIFSLILAWWYVDHESPSKNRPTGPQSVRNKPRYIPSSNDTAGWSHRSRSPRHKNEKYIITRTRRVHSPDRPKTAAYLAPLQPENLAMPAPLRTRSSISAQPRAEHHPPSSKYSTNAPPPPPPMPTLEEDDSHRKSTLPVMESVLKEPLGTRKDPSTVRTKEPHPSDPPIKFIPQPPTQPQPAIPWVQSQHQRHESPVFPSFRDLRNVSGQGQRVPIMTTPSMLNLNNASSTGTSTPRSIPLLSPSRYEPPQASFHGMGSAMRPYAFDRRPSSPYSPGLGLLPESRTAPYPAPHQRPDSGIDYDTRIAPFIDPNAPPLYEEPTMPQPTYSPISKTPPSLPPCRNEPTFRDSIEPLLRPPSRSQSQLQRRSVERLFQPQMQRRSIERLVQPQLQRRSAERLAQSQLQRRSIERLAQPSLQQRSVERLVQPEPQPKTSAEPPAEQSPVRRSPERSAQAEPQAAYEERPEKPTLQRRSVERLLQPRLGPQTEKVLRPPLPPQAQRLLKPIIPAVPPPHPSQIPLSAFNSPTDSSGAVPWPSLKKTPPMQQATSPPLSPVQSPSGLVSWERIALQNARMRTEIGSDTSPVSPLTVPFPGSTTRTSAFATGSPPQGVRRSSSTPSTLERMHSLERLGIPLPTSPGTGRWVITGQGGGGGGFEEAGPSLARSTSERSRRSGGGAGGSTGRDEKSERSDRSFTTATSGGGGGARRKSGGLSRKSGSGKSGRSGRSDLTSAGGEGTVSRSGSGKGKGVRWSRDVDYED